MNFEFYCSPAIVARRGIRRGFGIVADLLFPPVCAVCGSPGLDSSEPVCKTCGDAVERQCRAAYCPTCARTVPPFVVSKGRCNHCRDRKTRIAGAVRAGPYADTFGAIMRALKYRRRWPLGAYLGQRLATEIERSPWFDTVDALITVPTWWPRRILRGDYVPTTLASNVSRATGISVVPVLRRISGGPSQVGLTATQRTENVRGRFAVARGIRIDGATLCLIDDVMTTGATIEECAKVLRKAGARDVYAAVAAHVSPGSPSANPRELAS